MDRTLKQGHYIKGQEPYGCFNTGIAPTIANSKIARKYLDKKYVVGKDIEVLFHLKDNILLAMQGKKHNVKFYSNKARAFNEFERMSQKMIETINQDIKHVKELKAKAQAGDIASALALSDY